MWGGWRQPCGARNITHLERALAVHSRHTGLVLHQRCSKNFLKDDRRHPGNAKITPHHRHPLAPTLTRPTPARMGNRAELLIASCGRCAGVGGRRHCCTALRTFGAYSFLPLIAFYQTLCTPCRFRTGVHFRTQQSARKSWLANGQVWPPGLMALYFLCLYAFNLVPWQHRTGRTYFHICSYHTFLLLPRLSGANAQHQKSLAQRILHIKHAACPCYAPHHAMCCWSLLMGTSIKMPVDRGCTRMSRKQ